MKPNTVAGPRPNCTALPHFLCLLDVQISLRGGATSVNRGRNLWRFSSNSRSWKVPSHRTGYTIVEVLETWMSDVPREALRQWPRYFSGSSWSYCLLISVVKYVMGIILKLSFASMKIQKDYSYQPTVSVLMPCFNG